MKKAIFQKSSAFYVKPATLLLMVFTGISVLLTLGILGCLFAGILIKGIPYLSWDLFAWRYTSENCSLLPSLINTGIMVLVALGIALPLGVFSAIYLVEYARRESMGVKIVRLAAETLAGIPSILYGLFGMLFFVLALKWKYSMLSGGFTLGIMVLPVIMRTTEEALLAVPASYREGSYGLGAGKLQTLFRVLLPTAMPGILSGVILATGRIVGETAALLYTAGTVAKIPKSLMDSGSTLAVHMYMLFNEGLHMEQAYATAVVLLLVTMGMELLSGYFAKKMEKI